MAQLVLGIGTSHSPMLSLPGELWATYAQNDRRIQELAFPPDGVVLSFDEALRSHVAKEVKDRPRTAELFSAQSARCTAALDVLQDTLATSAPDVTVIVSDDQDEWFFESNMPSISIYWGRTVPVIPRVVPPDASEVVRLLNAGYGDEALDVPVPSRFGRHVIESLMDADFDVAHFNYLEQSYGGRTGRRYPTPDGELDVVRETAPRALGLPHGFSFVVKRLFGNRPSPILPVFQNTCYPPNQVRPKRSYALGEAIAHAVSGWAEDISVAVIASGGLSHFVTDEEFDRQLLTALEQKDADTLRNLPQHRLHSATSESLNWVAVGGAMASTSLKCEIVDYVPVYRTEAGTGGGWAFARWI